MLAQSSYLGETVCEIVCGRYNYMSDVEYNLPTKGLPIFPKLPHMPVSQITITHPSIIMTK